MVWMLWSMVWPFLALGLGAIVLLSMVFTVHQQTVRMVETFGKYSATKGAGLGFKLPWPIQSVSRPMSLRVAEISENVTVKSSDNAFLMVPIRVQYMVREERAFDAFYRLKDPEAQIRSYIVNQVRSTASDMTFDELFRARNTFEAEVSGTLEEKMTDFGYAIVNVLVDDPQPSDDLRKAFDRVIAATRLKEAAENEGAAARTLSVARAEAEGESLKIKGRAYAEFRQTVAQGNADAIDKFCDSTGLRAQDALAFFTSINEMEAVRDAATHGGRVVFVAGSAASQGAVPQGAVLGMVAGASDHDEKHKRAHADKAEPTAKDASADNAD
jgi:regulator of protease activity HflC (stomatin/prohibitin superfamily)